MVVDIGGVGVRQSVISELLQCPSIQSRKVSVAVCRSFEVKFIWTKECQEAFDELKRKLMTGPILALPKNEGMYVLDTDASDFGLGGQFSLNSNPKAKELSPMLHER